MDYLIQMLLAVLTSVLAVTLAAAICFLMVYVKRAVGRIFFRRH